jgi:hypothetical protein
MATQLAENPGTEIPGEVQSGEQDNTPVNFEAEARKMGWKAADEFKGDATQHVDAETFYKRGQELMPILRAQNKALLKRLDTMERDSKRAAEFFTKAEERAYERARSEILAKMEETAESGDVAGNKAAAEKLEKLEKPSSPVAKANRDPAQAAEEFADWTIENDWYDTDKPMTHYANAQAELLMKDGEFLGPDDLAEITRRVKAKFAAKFETKRTARNPVEGGGNAPARRGGHTYADLPPEAKAMCDKWVKNGTIASREDYVKGYQF